MLAVYIVQFSLLNCNDLKVLYTVAFSSGLLLCPEFKHSPYNLLLKHQPAAAHTVAFSP